MCSLCMQSATFTFRAMKKDDECIFASETCKWAFQLRKLNTNAAITFCDTIKWHTESNGDKMESDFDFTLNNISFSKKNYIKDGNEVWT